MKKYLYIFLIISAALAMTGCLGQEDESGFSPLKPEISFTQEVVNIAKDGGELKVTLNSNLPWRIKSSATWVSVAQNSGLEGGEITLTIARNRLREERTATLTAWVTDDNKAAIQIVQAPAEASESIIYHVKADGDGLASGASWEEATTLPTALDAAGDGDVILLAAGTYTPVALIAGGESEEEKTFDIHSNFTLEGGYPADAVTGAVADPASNETILSGNLGTTQAYHVVVISAVKSDANKVILKNLTISDGKSHSANKEIYRYAGESEFDAGEGAGLCIGVSNAELHNCRITGNSAFMAGGCIVAFGAEAVFNNCTISGNTVNGNGAGLWNEGDIVMYDCSVSNNRADLACAGYYGVGGKSRIYNSSFIGNDNAKGGKLGGGAYLREGNGRGSDAVFVNCTFADNKSGSGGAIAIYGTSAVGASAKLISCTIKGNTATKGGAIWMNNATPTAAIYNSILTGNSTEIEYGGTVVATESQVTKQTSIIGSVLLNAEGTTVSGWSFDAGSMLGALGYYNGGLTQSFPLIESDKNPAIGQGLSAEDLQSLAGEFADVETEFAAKDQNNQNRTGKHIGSYAL